MPVHPDVKPTPADGESARDFRAPGSGVPDSSEPDAAASDATVLRLEGLSVEFPRGHKRFRAIDDLSFSVKAGQTVALVGESGSGKSVTAQSIMRLVEKAGGEIVAGSIRLRSEAFGPLELVGAPGETMRAIRGNEIAMIFQEPMTSLNPVFTIGNQIGEAIALHRKRSTREARQDTLELLRKVRLPDAERLLDTYPHSLSGGMRQRAMIAMALSCSPRLLIADEPTTALDVTIQAQILALIRELQRETHTAVVFITHDMGVVAQMADHVVVMYRGRAVEQGPVEQIFHAPRHVYTQRLLAAVPRLGSLTGHALPQRQIRAADDSTVAVAHDTVQKGEPLLKVRNLSTHFDVRHTFLGRPTHRVHAVEDVSFDLAAGETLALVGESGSGKSTIGKSILRLVESQAGTVHLLGRPVSGSDRQAMKLLRQQVQYVFQDPFASLDPRKTIHFSVAEPIVTHRLIRDPRELDRHVMELLLRVGLDASFAGRYPHEMSGGQRQRVCIARALASNPRLVIADESVSALDVSIQSQILELLMKLQAEHQLSYLFITHDMAVVERIAHRVAILYLGQIVEAGTRRQVFENPVHPYTRRLLSAVPIADPSRRFNGRLIEGEIPSAVRQVGDAPARVRLDEIEPGHWVAQSDLSAQPALSAEPAVHHH